MSTLFPLRHPVRHCGWLLGFALVATPLQGARAQSATPLRPQLEINVGAPGPQVPRELFGTNLPARSDAAPRLGQLFRQLGISLYRFPGGDAPGWRWMNGGFDFSVGSNDSACTLTRVPPVFDFVTAAGGEVLMSVNIESAPASEAGALAAAVRGRGVRYWEIGNEAFGEWDAGYRSASAYAQAVSTYGAAIKAADPAALIGADMAGAYRDRDNDGDSVDTADWDRVVLRNAGATIDFLSYHWYPGRLASEEPMHVMAGSLRIPADVARFRTLAQTLTGRDIPLGYLEWDGVFDNDGTGIRHSLANAIFYADAFGQMMTTGVALSASYEANTRTYGIVTGYDSCAGSSWDGRTVRPKGYALELASRLAGGRLLPALLTGSSSYNVTTSHPLQEYAGSVPYLAAYAAALPGALRLLIVHRHPSQTAMLDVQLAGGASALAQTLKVSTLTGPSLLASNDGSPGTVAVSDTQLVANLPSFTLAVPPRAVLVVEIPRAGTGPATSPDAGSAAGDASLLDAGAIGADADANTDITPSRDGSSLPSISDGNGDAQTTGPAPSDEGAGCSCQLAGRADARGKPALPLMLGGLGVLAVLVARLVAFLRRRARPARA